MLQSSDSRPVLHSFCHSPNAACAHGIRVMWNLMHWGSVWLTKRNKTCKIPNLSQLNRQIIILCIQAMTLTLERICEGLTKFQRRFHLEISNDCREFLFCGNNKPITGTWRKRQEVWFGLIGVNLLMGKTAWGSCWKRSNMLSDFHYPYVYSMHTRA